MTPVDAVYTWVDDRDSRWLESLRKTLADSGFARESIDYGRNRFRNHDELRFSLRSLDRYAPWIRKIYIVTNGQRPGWLKTDNSRIQIVTHREIFPFADDLPTFNSNAIEMNLHRIPGLSDKFLYLNDDVFLGGVCRHSDFVHASADVMYFECIKIDQRLAQGTITDRAIWHTVAVVRGHPDAQPPEWAPAHTPQLYDRNLLLQLEQVFSDEFAQTRSHKFRSDRDFVLRIAYAAMGAGRGNVSRLLHSGNGDYSFLPLQPPIMGQLKALYSINALQPKFFCLNDDLSGNWKSALIARLALVFLQVYFRGKSAFEADARDH